MLKDETDVQRDNWQAATHFVGQPTLVWAPFDISRSSPKCSDTRGIQRSAYRNPAHQAQCRQATSVTCTDRKMDDRGSVAAGECHLFACFTPLSVLGDAYSLRPTLGPKESGKPETEVRLAQVLRP